MNLTLDRWACEVAGIGVNRVHVPSPTPLPSHHRETITKARIPMAMTMTCPRPANHLLPGPSSLGEMSSLGGVSGWNPTTDRYRGTEQIIGY